MLGVRFLTSHRAPLLFHVLLESRPKIELRLFHICEWGRTLGGALHCASPIIRAGDDVKLGSDRRFAYAPEFYLQTDERKFLPGDLIEPVERGAVLFGEPLGDPDDRHC